MRPVQLYNFSSVISVSKSVFILASKFEEKPGALAGLTALLVPRSKDHLLL
jgi:hypothetical protein